MSFYHRLGNVPPKRHTQFARPDGALYTEEVLGEEGFSGIGSIAYHIHPPTLVEAVEEPRDFGAEYVEDAFLKHRHFLGPKVEPGGDWLSGRRYIMGNQDIDMALCAPTESMPEDTFYKNATHDELVYVHDGAGRLETVLGTVEFEAGDYVHVPRTITHRWAFDGGTQPRLLVMEAPTDFRPPKRYRNDVGQLLEHSPYCERDFHPPTELNTVDQEGRFTVLIKKHGKLFPFVYRYHPFDVVGWDGYMYPSTFSIHDFEPITGRIHQPPPVHQTFEANGFVVCSFVPRLFDYHPDSIPAPYNHSNIDSDEVLYYAEGDFMSRKGIGRGSFTLHPGGIPHGPHPGTTEASIGAKETHELAVMVDTFRPLKLTKTALEIESPDYVLSWQPEKHGHPLPDAAPIPPGATVSGDGAAGAVPDSPPIDAARG
ncbi:homogentisate 1,2-dioxygenase [Rubrivirga sp. S365]|uniref:Homogentisate 1,2-dioxygenase n=1 Tax=Rubrivirga litoralis TaxID=3075598 RepID=A0ABU3BMT6_9BACT|nr:MULTISPECIES: homogentisate 1,2-dioxygenase [unclassified Rubrivirga]MDT0630586.1 homogentisate 1,2-dioxygenase [Rubrivirga sp. F394]MDT7857702.1 homogentisate 1,2-dioxygenase [Rubrivirga sp. S365]